MQTAEGIARVAQECAEDLAADGVVYAEVRWRPSSTRTAGSRSKKSSTLPYSGSVAVRPQLPSEATGFGSALSSPQCGTPPGPKIAELAVEYRDRGVVGFDIAGAEAGFPPTRHLDAFEYLRRENFSFQLIHAGEAFGLPSIWEAIQWCGTDRLGHGVRIVDDIQV